MDKNQKEILMDILNMLVTSKSTLEVEEIVTECRDFLVEARNSLSDEIDDEDLGIMH
jgi:hypothetical protein